MSGRREDEEDFVLRHRKLDAWALPVGHVCFGWSILEITIDSLLMRLIGFYGEGTSELVTSAIGWQRKLEIIRAAAAVSKMPDEWKEQITIALGEVKRLTERRNLFVHGLYWPMQDGAVVLEEAHARARTINGQRAVKSKERPILPTDLWDFVHQIHDVDRDVDNLWNELFEATSADSKVAE